MSKRNQRFFHNAIHFLQHLAVQGMAGLARRLSPASAYRLASFLGAAWFLLFRRRRAIIHRNLEVAFGDRLDERSREGIGRECCRHALATAMDLLVRAGVAGKDNWRSFAAMDPVLEEALFQPHPRGLAILSAHLGSWEMGQFFCGAAGAPVNPVMRTLDNPYLNRRSVELRSAFGAAVIPKIGALRGLLKVLRAGGRVAIMADQNAPVAGEFLPFFGAPAATYVDYAKVLVRQECDVLFTACLREGYRFRFRFASRRLAVPAAGSVEERARELVRSYLAVLEEVIARHPEQYLWMHRRWKRQPAGRPSLYEGLGKPLSQKLRKEIYANPENSPSYSRF
ncbi:MAG: hypothetical protein HY717_20025 [Planctomycetes bacterium]|nr:hypothetical protein [Planctomycetota bacterium]